MNPTSRKTLVRLGAPYALAWATTSMAVGPGSAALVRLSGHLSWAGVYVALFNVGAAAGAALGGRAMDRYGRRTPLMIAYILAAVGYAIAGAGAQRGLVPMLVIGAFILAACFGMFALSRVVGRFADRVGRLPTIFVGLALLSIGGAIVALVPGAAGFAVGLGLVGFGWSFGFIGSTVLLADAAPPARRAAMVGRADLTAQLASAVIALGGGWWFTTHGLSGLGLLAIAVASVPVAFLVRAAPRPVTT